MNGQGEKKMDRVMRLPEIAGVLGICERSVRRLVDRGELPPFVRAGRSVGLMQSDVEAYMEQMCEQRTMK